jgi:hypothetical protein
MKKQKGKPKSKNSNNLQPIYFSDYFKIDKQKLKKLGVFDPIINFDTALFVEPLLLKQSSSDIIKNSTKTYNEYFLNVLRLLRASKTEGDIAWQGAKTLINFPEYQYTCIGYAGISNGGSGLGKSQIEKILSNPFYYGYMLSKGNIYEHHYDRLITKALFDECQDVRFGRKTEKYKHTMKPCTYRGLIKCHHCGCSYSPEVQKGKYVYMRPTKSQGDCEHCVYVKEEVINAQLFPVIEQIHIPTPMLELVKECLKTVVNEQYNSKMKELNALRVKEQRLDEKRKRALDYFVSNSITKEEYDPLVTNIKTEQFEITCRIEELHKISDDFENQVITVFELANHSHDLFKSSEIDDKRKIVNLLFPNLFLDGQKLVFTLQKPFDKLIKMTGRPLWLPKAYDVRTSEYHSILSHYKRLHSVEELLMVA